VPTVPAAQAPTNRVEMDDTVVTPQPHQPGDLRIIGREEKIEYRDEDGNLLNEEQVKSLIAEGSASLQTKYETRTRIVDANGNEIPMPSPHAPEHPDVQGQNPDTKGVPESEGKSEPAQAQVPSGQSINKGQDGKPKPASDANEATK
jgi:dolichyl-phosphate-mannose-protein mannosyltransferase